SSRRRHTRFSRDWSSDVCSSDLRNHSTRTDKLLEGNIATVSRAPSTQQFILGLAAAAAPFVLSKLLDDVPILEIIGWIALPVVRSEERRVGKECSFRRSPLHS